jgi:DNA-binding transcriptional LysR family regulator
VLVANFLVKHLADFRRVHPGVQLSVSGEARQISLSRREADVALRLVRPEEGTSVVRKLGRMSFDLYASRDYPHLHNPSAWEFISYDAGFADMPQQKWLMSVANGRPVACEISDINGHLAATQAGAGVAGLPGFLADTDAKLQRVAYDGEPFSRDIWQAVHRDLRRSPQVRAVMDFLLKIVKENPAFTISG